jgi:flagellin-like protein
MRTKSRKALSPVIASIILIAVTVAVSIAVAAWMGALTFGFMGSSSLTITNVQFNGVSGVQTNANNITLLIKNTGTKQVTIGQVKVNNNIATIDNSAATTTTYPAGSSANVTITGTNANWSNGNPYKIDLYDSSGSGVGSTQVNGPGS